MPARDPAASPHIPTSPAHSATHQPLSPNSSAFSLRPGELPPHAGISGFESAGNDKRTSSFSFLRRVSGQGMTSSHTSSQHGGSGYGSTHPDEEIGRRHRRMSSVDADDIARVVSLGASSTSSSNAIRDSTNRLASLSFTSAAPRQRRPSHGSVEGSSQSQFSIFQPSASPLANKDRRPYQPSHLNPAVTGGLSPGSVTAISSVEDMPDGDFSSGKSFVPGSAGHIGRSGLSVMLERERAARAAGATSPILETPDSEEFNVGWAGQRTPHDSSSLNENDTPTPVPRKSSLVEDMDDGDSGESGPDDPNSSSALRRYLESEGARDDVERATERTPLMGKAGQAHKGLLNQINEAQKRLKKATARDVFRVAVEEPVKTMPAVVLGLLLNVLDGVSYGMILFPTNPVFQGFGSMGVSMFFVSCIVSQLTFSLGGSVFPGGNGSMMIEAVPFFHILINIIQQELGDDTKDAAIISTTMVAFAFSSILTGLVFFILGAFRLGGLIGYFPRHILVGCIGGVGIFLIETGLEVSRGLKEDGFEYNLATLKLFFDSGHSILLWTLPLGLAILLRVITHFWHHQLVFPAYFFIIPIIFYIVIAIGGWSFAHLRTTGWVFDVGDSSESWWKFYTYFDFGKTSWTAFWAAMPTQLALVFFGILHVPLNVPALGVSLQEDNVKLDRELIAHGVSNAVAGLAGTVPNYLTYVNTVLFYRVGGGSRLSGLLLAAATFAIMAVGPTVIGYLPVMVVGALIFVLGIDLTIEAVWDTRHRVSRSEYITIWAIAIGMTVWDFVIGLLFGIILACIFFVVTNSRRRAIRAVFSGSTAKSTVRRPRSQRSFIQQVGSQTYVMKLQGFLFFGTITTVENEIRKLLDLAKWQHNPIRFLIIDFHLVHGLDFSAAEAFVRLQRLLTAKDVLLIMCGAAPTGPVAPSLQAVDLWADREGSRVECFTNLNEALEWTENAYLTAFYDNQKAEEAAATHRIDFPKIAKPPFSLAESFQNSPRRSHLAKAGGDHLRTTFLRPEAIAEEPQDQQPLPLLIQTLGSYTEQPNDFFRSLVPYFKQCVMMAGEVVWNQDDLADGLYLIESGSLRATYEYEHYPKLIQETMVAGTIAGDLSTLSETNRNATVVVDRDCVLWKLDQASLNRMEAEKPELAGAFTKIVLKAVAEEQEVLSSHLIAMLS